MRDKIKAVFCFLLAVMLGLVLLYLCLVLKAITAAR